MEQNALILEAPEQINEIYAEPRIVEVFEIQEHTAHNRSKCFFILLAWLIIFLSLIILKTLFWSMESEREIQREAPFTFAEKCKLGIFLTICISIVIYIGLCLRAVYTMPFYYPETFCDKWK